MNKGKEAGHLDNFISVTLCRWPSAVYSIAFEQKYFPHFFTMANENLIKWLIISHYLSFNPFPLLTHYFYSNAWDNGEIKREVVRERRGKKDGEGREGEGK